MAIYIDIHWQNVIIVLFTYNFVHLKLSKSSVSVHAVVHVPHSFMFLCESREDEGRRKRFRRREGDEAGGGGDNEDPVAEEDGYGAFCSHAQSEEIYQDLCSLHLPPPPSVAQVFIFSHLFLVQLLTVFSSRIHIDNYTYTHLCIYGRLILSIIALQPTHRDCTLIL